MTPSYRGFISEHWNDWNLCEGEPKVACATGAATAHDLTAPYDARSNDSPAEVAEADFEVARNFAPLISHFVYDVGEGVGILHGAVDGKVVVIAIDLNDCGA